MYIFLDIDGVLTTPKQWDLRRSSNELMPYPFDNDCVKNMNEIISLATYDTKFIKLEQETHSSRRVDGRNATATL